MKTTILRLAAVAMLVASLARLAVPASAAEDGEDFAIPNGRVFPQSGGFSIADEGGIPFWTEYQRLGGAHVLGFPVSGRFQIEGYAMQALQKGILQWRPREQRAVLTNVLDDLSRFGRDEWLFGFRQTPRPLPAGFDGSRPWDEVVKRRQGLLDADQAIRERYFAAADPISSYGLPTSPVQDMGNHVAVRLQRAVMQRWKVDVPWAKAGEVTIANAGELARDAGLIPVAALKPAVTVLEGQADRIPWSGWWWPADEGVAGPHLFDVDGPLAKYDRLARARGRPDIQVRAWELANVRLTGGLYPWAGHCNGWAAAAILEAEPRAPRTIDGITFSVADQKGLLSSWHFADGVEWIFGDDDVGVRPADLHRSILQWLGAGRRAFIVNTYSGTDQVLNFPAYRYRIVYGPDALDPARTHVRATLWFADYNVDANFTGLRNWPNDNGRTYEYFITGDRNNPSGGGWEGASAASTTYSRPWRVWYPNPNERNVSRPLASPALDYGVIRAIVDVR